MDIIIETLFIRQVAYEKYRDGKLIQKVRVLSIQKEYEGFRYMFLLDSYGKTFVDVYEYLNDYLKSKTTNHREMSLNALKIFFSFTELFNIPDYKKITRPDAMRLRSFLAGNKVRGVDDVTFDTTTKRSSRTFNMYASVYRDYFCFLGVPDNENVFKNKRVAVIFRSGYGKIAHTKKTRIEQYTYSEKANLKDNEVPDYVSFDEYTRILEIIDKKYSLREKIIVMLGYEHGLRISEALGLTLEDIEMKGAGPIVALRNRLTDRKYQFCKTLIHPSSHEDYSFAVYRQIKVGWNFQPISNHLYDLITQYINETRSAIIMSGNKKAIANIVQRTADKVTNRTDIDENFYLFMGKNYTPLTGSGWNKIMRNIFTDAGIPVDKDTRQHNLNHKFRHGRAMFLKLHMAATRERIAEELRHNSVHSAVIYFRPTREDRLKNARKAQELLDRKLGRENQGRTTN